MAIGAHADDIELNVGGTILKYFDLGYEVDYVLSTNNMSGQFRTKNPDGSLTRFNTPWHEMMPVRKQEAAAAAAAVNTEAIHLNHPQRHYYDDNGTQHEVRYGSMQPGEIGPDSPTILTAHQYPGPVKALADLIVARNPEAVLVHGMIMVDMEHVGTALLTTKAYWQAVEQGYQGMLLHWTDAMVGLFGDAHVSWGTQVDISHFWAQKMDWVRLHASVILDPEEVEFAPRGAACGCIHVEAYDIVSRGNSRVETPFNTEIRRNSRR